jgi:hypothetical protein
LEWLKSALAAFVLIVPVELPDKTFVATLVLATRYRALLVWLGVTAAFGIQCLVAVVAGRLLTLLPDVRSSSRRPVCSRRARSSSSSAPARPTPRRRRTSAGFEKKLADSAHRLAGVRRQLPGAVRGRVG